MKVSCVITTARFGGMDMLLNWARSQTMPIFDFEIILVDELFDQRKEMFCEPGFNLTHVKAPGHPFYDNSAGFNEGLRWARGELVCFAVDFQWLPPDYLERHWNFYRQHPGWSLTGFVDRYAFPPLRSDLESRGSIWSIFEQEFDAEFAKRWFGEQNPVYRERKGGAGIFHPNGIFEMPGDKIYLIPDSIPLEILKELGGLDTRYDGGYG